jgi:hypothetical protein
MDVLINAGALLALGNAVTVAGLLAMFCRERADWRPAAPLGFVIVFWLGIAGFLWGQS